MTDFDYETCADGYVIYQNGKIITAYDLVSILNGSNRDKLVELRGATIQLLNILDDILGLERCVKTRKERREKVHID